MKLLYKYKQTTRLHISEVKKKKKRKLKSKLKVIYFLLLK